MHVCLFNACMYNYNVCNLCVYASGHASILCIPTNADYVYTCTYILWATTELDGQTKHDIGRI